MDRAPAGTVAPGDTAVAEDSGARSGILNLYRAIIATGAAFARRRHLDIVAEVVLIGAYFALRTANANDLALARWLIVASVAAILSPTSGLVVLAAIAPFSEGLSITRDIGSKTALAFVLIAAVGVRMAVDRGARVRPSVPVVLAAALFIASGLGLWRTLDRWGAEFAQDAAQFWLQSIGTMLVVFVVSVWVARHGVLRPLVVTVLVATIGGLISLADFLGVGAVRAQLLGWAVVAPESGRLMGIMRSPTSTAALMMLPIAVFIATAILARDWRLRIAAAVAAVPLLVASYLTYNRGVFLALYILAVVIGWRIRRALGIGILIVGLGIGAILLPPYLTLRGSAVGSVAVAQPGQVLITSDQQRLTAWAAAARMFVDEPLLGQGYRAYRQLSVQFGDPQLNAPHNEWLRFFAEGGIVTGVIAAAFAAATGLVLVRRRGWLETGLFGAFASFCVAATFNNPFLFNQVTIPAFVLAGTGVALASGPSPEVSVSD